MLTGGKQSIMTPVTMCNGALIGDYVLYGHSYEALVQFCGRGCRATSLAMRQIMGVAIAERRWDL